jgi:hypothetical protein
MADLNKLIEAARKLGGHKTKKAAVTAALDEYILRHKREQAVQAFGTFDFDPSYDYKAGRSARRDWPIFTLDHEFDGYAKYLPIKIFRAK